MLERRASLDARPPASPRGVAAGRGWSPTPPTSPSPIRAKRGALAARAADLAAASAEAGDAARSASDDLGRQCLRWRTRAPASASRCATSSDADDPAAAPLLARRQLRTEQTAFADRSRASARRWPRRCRTPAPPRAISASSPPGRRSPARAARRGRRAVRGHHRRRPPRARRPDRPPAGGDRGAGPGRGHRALGHRGRHPARARVDEQDQRDRARRAADQRPARHRGDGADQRQRVKRSEHTSSSSRVWRRRLDERQARWPKSRGVEMWARPARRKADRACGAGAGPENMSQTGRLARAIRRDVLTAREQVAQTGRSSATP